MKYCQIYMSELTQLNQSFDVSHIERIKNNVVDKFKQWLPNLFQASQEEPTKVLEIIAHPDLVPESTPTVTINEEVVAPESYPSETTKNYFENWGEQVVNGNAEIKDTIKTNIINSELAREETYARFARRSDLSVDEFKQKVQEAVDNTIKKSGLYRAVTPYELKQVLLVDGRFKSQIETGTTSSGTLDPTRRAEIERKMFGFDPLESATKRPIYGYVSDGEHGVVNDWGDSSKKSRLAVFGGIVIEFDTESVQDKTTITFHDSLQYEEEIPPTPFTKPHFTSLALNDVSYKLLKPDELHTSREGDLWFPHYVEAQFHNQLEARHIKAIHISETNGLSKDEIIDIKDNFNKYKEMHTDSKVQLIEF